MARSLERIVELGRKDAAQVREVLDANPDLPIILVTENGPNDFSWYYHEGIGARVEHLLFPEFVEGWGLNEEKIYDDLGDAVEDVATHLFEEWYDHAYKYATLEQRQSMREAIPDDGLTAFCGYDYDYEHNVSIDHMAEVLAYELVNDMPWQEYVVVRGWL